MIINRSQFGAFLSLVKRTYNTNPVVHGTPWNEELARFRLDGEIVYVSEHCQIDKVKIHCDDEKQLHELDKLWKANESPM